MANPNLEMFRSDTLAEVGTSVVPIDFGLCDAGEETLLAYDILLYNDKTGALGSEDAKSIEIELLRMIIEQNETGDGTASQTHTLVYIPVISGTDEVTVDGTEWRRVTSFAGLGASDKVYTLNYTTGVILFGNGVEGEKPGAGEAIVISYTPDLNTYGKTIYTDKWISVKSDGVVQVELHIGAVTPEHSAKIDNDNIQVLHYPGLTDVVGVWDNASKTGTNYYTSGSYDSDTGIITLGASLVGADAYTEYKYEIKDDNEGVYSAIGNGDKHSFDNRIPSKNAKKLSFKVDVPTTASTEGGSYLKAIFRILYSF